MALSDMRTEDVAMLTAAAAIMYSAPMERRRGRTNGETAWSGFVIRWRGNANGRRAKSSPGADEHPTSPGLERILSETGAWVW